MSTNGPPRQDHDETAAIAAEQHALNDRYSRVDTLRDDVARKLDHALRVPTGDSTALLDRDTEVARLQEKNAELARAEHGLCFGRLDRQDDSTTYIGRMGLRSQELEPMVIDWRAPAAADFYTATAASGSDVRRRRHLRTRGRTVVGVNDELLDLDGADSAFVGEAALMQALTSERTGRMADVVATLQGEQDAIIRSPMDGALVVQGGPGTGKTAVALHRTAYLLYTYPQIAQRGVLVLGPSATFLDYIDQVLPSLGETHAVLATMENLLPGVVATGTETAAAAAVKAKPVMAQVIARSVRRHEGTDQARTITYQGDAYRIEPAVVAATVERARLTGLAHNLARRTFASELLDYLTEAVLAHDRQLYDDADRGFETELDALDQALAKGTDALPAKVEGAGTEVTGLAGEHEAPRVRAELEREPQVHQLLEELWPLLSPTDLLRRLYTDEDLRGASAPELSRAEQDTLSRPETAWEGLTWASGDVPLLDEAAELLGEDDTAAQERRRAAQAAAVAYAQQVLSTTGGLGISAEELAGRFEESDTRPLAERAAADRTWAYGHVIVDEAQELTPMQWRMVLRRVPSKSLTVVGDVHQTSAGAGTDSWETLTRAEPQLQWNPVELTINYRTPEPIMRAATRMASRAGAAVPTSHCARTDGTEPQIRATDGDFAVALGHWAAAEAQLEGTLAVIAPPERLVEIAMIVEDSVPGAVFGPEVDLHTPCVVLTPQQAKGLEFDAVLVADPATILAADRGVNALYVAMTRPTQRLNVLCEGPVPEALR